VRHAVSSNSPSKVDQSQVVGAGGLDLIVDHPEVILAFLGLDQIPRHDAQDGIEVHLGQSRPGRFHGLDIRRTGVGQLSGDADEGPAIHDELGHAVAFFRWGMSVGAASARSANEAERTSASSSDFFIRYGSDIPKNASAGLL